MLGRHAICEAFDAGEARETNEDNKALHARSTFEAVIHASPAKTVGPVRPASSAKLAQRACETKKACETTVKPEEHWSHPAACPQRKFNMRG